MTTVSERSKALRGTKRVCQACEVRFYDLARDPIVCPACGAHFTVVVRPAVDETAYKPGPRNRGFKRPDVVLPVVAAEDAAPEEVADVEELEVEAEDAVAPPPEDDSVLEPDGEETDVTELVDLDVEEPKER